MDQVGINQLDLIEWLPGWLSTGRVGVNSMKWERAGIDNVGISQTRQCGHQPDWVDVN